jgi:hypothetical protein
MTECKAPSRVSAEMKPVTLRNPDVGAARDGIAPLHKFIKSDFPPKASRFSAGRHCFYTSLPIKKSFDRFPLIIMFPSK